MEATVTITLKEYEELKQCKERVFFVAGMGVWFDKDGNPSRDDASSSTPEMTFANIDVMISSRKLDAEQDHAGRMIAARERMAKMAEAWRKSQCSE